MIVIPGHEGTCDLRPEMKSPDDGSAEPDDPPNAGKKPVSRQQFLVNDKLGIVKAAGAFRKCLTATPASGAVRQEEEAEEGRSSHTPQVTL